MTNAIKNNKIVSFDEFIPLALRTESIPNSVRTNVNVLVATIAANIASSEILDGFKKQIFYGKTEKLLTKTSYYTKILQDSVDIINTSDLTEASLGTMVPINPRVLHGLLGAITEAGELAAVLHKGVDGEEIDVVNVQEEFSDIMWYVAIIYDELSLDYYQGLTNVIDKLIVRYPEKFSGELADNRNLTEERKQLEKK